MKRRRISNPIFRRRFLHKPLSLDAFLAEIDNLSPKEIIDKYSRYLTEDEIRDLLQKGGDDIKWTMHLN